MTTTIAVCDYGSGNLHSVSRALERVGASVRMAEAPAALAGADAIVIPGVGHFGQCVRALRAVGLRRIRSDEHEAFIREMRDIAPGRQTGFQRPVDRGDTRGEAGFIDGRLASDGAVRALAS